MAVLDRFRLDGRCAFITGGSRGLGRAMAASLAEAGADLVIVGRDAGALDQAQAELRLHGRRVEVVQADIGTPDGATHACEMALHLGWPIDIAVNNVGGRRVNVPTETFDIDQWKALFDLNLTSALVVCQRLGTPMLARQRGSIINLTSIAGPIAMKGIRGRHYEAAKHALASLTRSLAADWAPHGVRVNAIAPGVFETEPNKKWFAEMPSYRQTFLSHIPMERFGTPDELGPAVVYLASDASSYMTGATLTIDGGFTIW